MTKTCRKDHPHVIAPPPAIYLGFLGLGLLMEQQWPTQIFSGPLMAFVGLLILIIGVAGVITAVRTIIKARTPVDPYESTTTIVTRGLYRISRNPIYVFDTFVYIGLAMSFNSFWAIVLMPLLLWTLQRGVVLREEQYLRCRFGDKYMRYQKGVRRWI